MPSLQTCLVAQLGARALALAATHSNVLIFKLFSEKTSTPRVLGVDLNVYELCIGQGWGAAVKCPKGAATQP